MSADNFLEVDKAAYITFEAAMQTLDVEVKKQIQSIKTISTSKDTSVAPKGINFNKSGIKGIFMGVYENQIHYGNTINSFKLAINEISEKGDVGEKFFLTLHSKVAEEWQNNATVKLFTKKIGKAIIVFQNIPYQIKSRNIEFHLMVSIQDDGSDYIVVNYLCSREEHTRNMRLLVEGTPNIDDYEYDENVFLERSYHYICPFCDSRKIPHSLCTLKPSYFLRMHVTEKSIANADSESPTECLHILATGVHAEYFLGTKADHVLRSQVVWKRAEQRIAKLVESKQPLTLGLIRRESNPNEICLEFTKTVFASNHLLPWR